MDNIQYALATVNGRNGSHALVLLAGWIMIPVIWIFENACHRFFQNKKLPEAEHILSIIYNFESSAVQAWITTHHDRLVALTFGEFFMEFKNKFLPANWKDNLIAMQITLQSSQAFLMWTEGVCKANTESSIAGSTYHIPKDKLHAHFVPHLSPALKTLYNANNTHGTLDAIMDLEAWIQHVHLLDLENQSKCEEWLKITQASAHTNTKGATAQVTTALTNNGGKANLVAATGNTGGPGILANTTNSQQPPTPKLTQPEHDLLKAHRGCFCCRVCYAGHYAPDCPLSTNERPSVEACKNVTITAALKAKAVFEGKGSAFVATMFEDEDESEEFEMTGEEADK